MRHVEIGASVVRLSYRDSRMSHRDSKMSYRDNKMSYRYCVESLSDRF